MVFCAASDRDVTTLKSRSRKTLRDFQDFDFVFFDRYAKSSVVGRVHNPAGEVFRSIFDLGFCDHFSEGFDFVIDVVSCTTVFSLNIVVDKGDLREFFNYFQLMMTCEVFMHRRQEIPSSSRACARRAPELIRPATQIATPPPDTRVL